MTRRTLFKNQTSEMMNINWILSRYKVVVIVIEKNDFRSRLWIEKVYINNLFVLKSKNNWYVRKYNNLFLSITINILCSRSVEKKRHRRIYFSSFFFFFKWPCISYDLWHKILLYELKSWIRISKMNQSCYFNQTVHITDLRLWMNDWK